MTDAPARTFLGGFDQPDDTVESRMISELDRVLGQPPRTCLAAGDILFRVDENLDGIWVLLDGKVKLYQDIRGEQVIFHSQTAGRIIGLLALARRSRAFFTCQAVAPATLIHVTTAQLENALQQSEDLRISFITVLLRSMARRNRRLVELQSEVLTLNERLEHERDQLQRTLAELKQAQALLVESEKMATLGQLSAGVAHELNNPVAAIDRAASFVQDDLLGLAESLPNPEVFRTMLRRALEEKPISTREERERRRRLQDELGDETLARTVSSIGIGSAQEFDALCREVGAPRAEAAERLACYHHLGASLRNIDHCADRITNLVKSLRSYIHADRAGASVTDVRVGIDDTLSLFTNRLRDVEVIRDYEEIPHIVAHAGELNQVWTNLVANALDAIDNRGTLTVRTAPGPGKTVEVSVIDNGPGIPPENLDKIFDMRFTTRQGRVEFGLGLGLSITRNIVARHGGRIDVASKPGRTAFTVTLPVSPDQPLSPQPQETTP